MSGAVAPRLRRICLVVDIEAYSGRPYRVQQKVQERLDRALDHACARAGVDRTRCEAQDRGDGQLLLLPPDADEAKALPGLVLGLRDALHTLNRAPGTAGRLRVRAALAQGGVQRAALGFVARSVETACRLLDCQQARAALKAAPDTDLAVVVADDLFADGFATGGGGVPVEEFTRITVALPAKRFEARAWIGTPRPGALVALPSPAPSGSRRRAAGSALLRGLGDALAGAALGATPPHHGHDDPPQHHEGHNGHGHGHHEEQHGHHHGEHAEHQPEHGTDRATDRAADQAAGGGPDHHHDDHWPHHYGHDTDAWAADPHHHDPHHEDTGTPYDDPHAHDGHLHGHDTHDPYGAGAGYDGSGYDGSPDHGWHGPHH
ncbi:hypothetical protein ACFXAF_33320 [Kitasatospora sp. NPDC059463]|uniref:hypothetical protein n=1 Tax=unclassified Kitasatospora TaxID=2633591 RepID=UPI003683A4AC